MGTEVLWPQDCLSQRSPATVFPRRRSFNYNQVPNYHAFNYDLATRFNRKPVSHRKRVGSGSDGMIPRRRSSSCGDFEKAWKVTILRRGESLGSAPATEKRDVYAGSAFVVSPEPSSVPLPSFSRKKQISFDDSATRDLRRLLRLDS